MDNCILHSDQMNISTSSFFLNFVLFSLGVWILIKGSDGVIEGAATVARYFHIPDLVIGITLVSIGTSLPELATNVYAAAINEGSVAIGNVVGSNVTNVLLVAGVAITGLKRIPIDKIMFYRDGGTMMLVYLLFSAFCYISDGVGYSLSRPEGGILISGCVIYVVYLLFFRSQTIEIPHPDSTATTNRKMVIGAACKAVLSCFLVILGAKLIVDNVVWAAKRMEIPQELISATVIALGTSLPEVAVTVSGIVKKKRDIALGNIIGSNIFNVLLIMGITAAIRPIPAGPEVRAFLLPYMLLTGAIFLVFMRVTWTLARWQGVLFLIGYLFFILWNVRSM